MRPAAFGVAFLSALVTVAALFLGVSWPYIGLPFRIGSIVTILLLFGLTASWARSAFLVTPRVPAWPFVIAAVVPALGGILLLVAPAVDARVGAGVTPPAVLLTYGMPLLFVAAVAAALARALARWAPSAVFAGPAFAGVGASVAALVSTVAGAAECGPACQAEVAWIAAAGFLLLTSLVGLLAVAVPIRASAASGSGWSR